MRTVGCIHQQKWFWIGNECCEFALGNVREGKAVCGADMPLAAQSHSIPGFFEVVNEALGAFADLAVVGICAAANGKQSGVELLSSGRAHSGRGECKIEFQPFFG